MFWLSLSIKFKNVQFSLSPLHGNLVITDLVADVALSIELVGFEPLNAFGADVRVTAANGLAGACFLALDDVLYDFDLGAVVEDDGEGTMVVFANGFADPVFANGFVDPLFAKRFKDPVFSCVDALLFCAHCPFLEDKTKVVCAPKRKIIDERT